jgi:hypothetical protein
MEISRPKSDFWFACVDIAVIKDEKLSPCDKAIYMTFCAHADVKTRKTPISVKTLADETGCGIRTAQKSIKTLIERGVLERREQYKDGRQLVSSYRLIGHNAGCYRRSDVTEEFSPHLPENPIDDLTALEENGESRGAIIAEAAENDVYEGAKSAGHAESCTPGCAESAHRYLEPVFNENQNIPPYAPQEEEREEGVDFETEKDPGDENLRESYDTGERSKIQRREFYDAILNAYHTILPELPRYGQLTASGTGLIEARIEEDSGRGNLDWWMRYFNRVREFPWPMGENDKGWKSDFLWLLSEKGMEKINSEHFSRYPVTERSVSECLERQRKYTDERGIVDGAAVLRNC